MTERFGFSPSPPVDNITIEQWTQMAAYAQTDAARDGLHTMGADLLDEHRKLVAVRDACKKKAIDAYGPDALDINHHPQLHTLLSGDYDPVANHIIAKHLDLDPVASMREHDKWQKQGYSIPHVGDITMLLLDSPSGRPRTMTPLAALMDPHISLTSITYDERMRDDRAMQGEVGHIANYELKVRTVWEELQDGHRTSAARNLYNAIFFDNSPYEPNKADPELRRRLSESEYKEYVPQRVTDEVRAARLISLLQHLQVGGKLVITGNPNNLPYIASALDTVDTGTHTLEIYPTTKSRAMEVNYDIPYMNVVESTGRLAAVITNHEGPARDLRHPKTFNR